MYDKVFEVILITFENVKYRPNDSFLNTITLVLYHVLFLVIPTPKPPSNTVRTNVIQIMVSDIMYKWYCVCVLGLVNNQEFLLVVDLIWLGI